VDLGLRLFDILVVLVGALGGWIMNNIHTAVRDLQSADKQLAEKVGKIEVLVAGDYVRKDEFARVMDDVKGTLVRIEDKIDRKADRAY
jgi:hypothetical protein